MREFIKAICFIGGCLFFIPFMVVYVGGYQNENLLQEINSVSQTQSAQKNTSDFIQEEQIIGILAKEIPYTYEYEAIKAQAVVIRTYMARRILGIQNKGELIGYSLEEMQDLWGESFNNIYATYQDAVKETQNEIILYDSEPIEALYHRANGGKTRSAHEIYNVEVPYLISVMSEKNPVTKQVEMSKHEMSNKLREVYSDLIVDEKTLENQIQIVEKDEAEYIKSIQIGNRVIKGEEFRKIIGLPSSNFKIFNHGETLIFDVKGAGSGVGLSQNGANELAKEGKKYHEIIKHYYTDIIIQNYIHKK
ncbi:SpoIID/LytB domain-containing protein [Cellulosilyticum sp. I15G10I2]|uniref:SpoIID/LytB domain-containing protein n=1 Tax=Cellulosilyticum sp. I15G10I2 TaxID=1892843 RepID=UPI00085BC5D7|nr:SpoIID/LytB domain-containing protein [Cellulosilyticum sp. I15G10I2]